nr:hypothetical protein [Gammaproteobacteria bacterium]
INRKQTIKLNFFLWLYLKHEINKLKSSEQYSDSMQEAFNLFATQLREDAYDYRAAKDHVAPKLHLKNQKMFWQEKMMPAIQTAADNIQRKKATIAASAA